MRYLFVMAHPDDEVDVGGTIHKLASSGNEVAVAILVGNATARRNLSNSLASDEQKSMKILGVSEIYHAYFPNIKTNTVPHLDLVRFIEGCIETWGAEAVVTHHTADLNVDHAIVSVAATAACRSFQIREVYPRLRLLMYCESTGATEWALDDTRNRFTPNFFVEIGNEGLETKLQAQHAYSGVRRLYPHPYSPESIEGLATIRGAQSGCDYAEAFHCVFWSE